MSVGQAGRCGGVWRCALVLLALVGGLGSAQAEEPGVSHPYTVTAIELVGTSQADARRSVVADVLRRGGHHVAECEAVVDQKERITQMLARIHEDQDTAHADIVAIIKDLADTGCMIPEGTDQFAIVRVTDSEDLGQRSVIVEILTSAGVRRGVARADVSAGDGYRWESLTDLAIARALRDANVPPTAGWMVASDDRVGGEVRLASSSSDNEQDPLRFEWDVRGWTCRWSEPKRTASAAITSNEPACGRGPPYYLELPVAGSNEQSGREWSFTPHRAGTYTVRITALDDHGGRDEYSETLFVRPRWAWTLGFLDAVVRLPPEVLSTDIPICVIGDIIATRRANIIVGRTIFDWSMGFGAGYSGLGRTHALSATAIVNLRWLVWMDQIGLDVAVSTTVATGFSDPLPFENVAILLITPGLAIDMSDSYRISRVGHGPQRQTVVMGPSVAVYSVDAWSKGGPTQIVPSMGFTVMLMWWL